MSGVRQAGGRDREGGFALLVMFGLIASASVGLLLVVEAFAPPLADVTERIDSGLAKIETSARDQCRRAGTFPGTLSGLAAVADGITMAPWRTDPHGAGADLDYGMVGNSLRVRSRGADGALGTGDDRQANVAMEPLVRVRQRARLRLVRAVLARSQYRHVASMSAAEEASMVAAMRDYAIARREWWTADAAERIALQSRMDNAATTVSSLSSLHSCQPLPAFVVGSGGLMEGLGLPDAKAVDGLGAGLMRDATVGVVARGSDATGGTDDDM